MRYPKFLAFNAAGGGLAAWLAALGEVDRDRAADPVRVAATATPTATPDDGVVEARRRRAPEQP